MKKILSIIFVLTLVFSLTACGSNGDEGETKGTTPATTEANDTAEDETPEVAEDQVEGADLSGTINITGSTSVDKIINDMAADFMALNPDVTINYTGTGSSAGIEDAINDRNDLGASSREVKEEELAEGISTTIFAYDGIATIVHPSNEVADLSMEQILQIYSGEITNWSEVGGVDASINVISREGASGTRSAFEELIGIGDDVELFEDVTVVEGNGTVQSTVAGDENAIGYVSFSFIDETVKALTVEEAEATAENVKAGDYKLSRPFILTYKEENLTPQVSAFLDYILTPDAQVFVEDHGGITVE